MKKIVSIITALTLGTSLSGVFVPSERDISAYAAESDTTEINDILPDDYNSSLEFLEEYGGLSVHGKYLVLCDDFGDISDINEIYLYPKGEGSLKQVKKYEVEHRYEICGDQYCDSMGIIVYEAQRTGSVHADLMRKSEFYDNTWKIWETDLYINSDLEFSTRSEFANGDTNCDGNVTIADAAAILQYLGNADKFPLSAESKLFADVIDPGDGVTTADAMAIQKKLLGLIESLPASYYEGENGIEYSEYEEYFAPEHYGKFSGSFRLNVSAAPDKTVYKVGEELDLTGLRFSGSGGTYGIYIDMFDSPYETAGVISDCSEFDNTKPGEYTLRFYFNTRNYSNIDFHTNTPAELVVTVIEG